MVGGVGCERDYCKAAQTSPDPQGAMDSLEDTRGVLSVRTDWIARGRACGAVLGAPQPTTTVPAHCVHPIETYQTMFYPTR